MISNLGVIMDGFEKFLAILIEHMHERDINPHGCVIKSGLVEIFLDSHMDVPQDKKKFFIEKLLVVNNIVVGLQYRKSHNDLWKTMPNFPYERV